MKTVVPALRLSGWTASLPKTRVAAKEALSRRRRRSPARCGLRVLRSWTISGPKRLVKNVKALAAFFERRNLLQDLAAKLDGNDALQASLQKMLFPTGDSASELDALRKVYKEALASVDARDAVSKGRRGPRKTKGR